MNVFDTIYDNIPIIKGVIINKEIIETIFKSKGRADRLSCIADMRTEDHDGISRRIEIIFKNCIPNMTTAPIK